MKRKKYMTEQVLRRVRRWSCQNQSRLFMFGVSSSIVPAYMDLLTPNGVRRVNRTLNEDTYASAVISIGNEYLDHLDKAKATIHSTERDKELVDRKRSEYKKWQSVQLEGCPSLQYFLQFVCEVKSTRMEWSTQHCDACMLLEETRLQFAQVNNDRHSHMFQCLLEKLQTFIDLLWNVVSLHRLKADWHEFEVTRSTYERSFLYRYKEYGLEYRARLRCHMMQVQEQIFLFEEHSNLAVTRKWLHMLDVIEPIRKKFPLKFLKR